MQIVSEAFRLFAAGCLAALLALIILVFKALVGGRWRECCRSSRFSIMGTQEFREWRKCHCEEDAEAMIENAYAKKGNWAGD